MEDEIVLDSRINNSTHPYLCQFKNYYKMNDFPSLICIHAQKQTDRNVLEKTETTTRKVTDVINK